MIAYKVDLFVSNLVKGRKSGKLSLLLLLSGSVFFAARPAYSDQQFDGGLNSVGLAQTLGTIGQQSGVLRFAVRPSRCEAVETSEQTSNFCEMALLNTRVRAWSKVEGGPIFKITARPSRDTSAKAFLIALQVIVQAVDPDISDDRAYIISKALLSSDETLKGSAAIDGSTARYRSEIDRTGLIVTVTPR